MRPPFQHGGTENAEETRRERKTIHRLPGPAGGSREWRSRTFPMPRRRGRGGGSARCRRGSRARRARRRLSCRSGTSASYSDLDQWRGGETGGVFGRRQQRADHVVVVRLGDEKTADLALSGLVALEIIDEGDAVDL